MQFNVMPRRRKNQHYVESEEWRQTKTDVHRTELRICLSTTVYWSMWHHFWHRTETHDDKTVGREHTAAYLLVYWLVVRSATLQTEWNSQECQEHILRVMSLLGVTCVYTSVQLHEYMRVVFMLRSNSLINFHPLLLVLWKSRKSVCILNLCSCRV